MSLEETDRRRTDLREAAPELQVQDVVVQQLLQALVQVVPHHGRVRDEAGGGDEGLLKLLPHDLLARVFALWILGEQREALH